MSVGFSGFDLTPPTDWQQFERLCRDLWASIWDDPDTQMHGRGGQEQAGVDVYGQPRAGDGYSAIQCKRKGNVLDDAEISERELREEVTKAKSFTPLLKGEFILAFTGKRDAKIQAVARAITEEHQAAGLFKVVVYSWEDSSVKVTERYARKLAETMCLAVAETLFPKSSPLLLPEIAKTAGKMRSRFRDLNSRPAVYEGTPNRSKNTKMIGGVFPRGNIDGTPSAWALALAAESVFQKAAIANAPDPESSAAPNEQ